MPKKATLKIDGGSIQDGFNVTLQIANEGEPLSTEIALKPFDAYIINADNQIFNIEKPQRGDINIARGIAPGGGKEGS